MKSFIGESASFVDGGDVEIREESLEELILLPVSWVGLETWALEHGFLEWESSFEPAVRGDLVHDRAGASGLSEDGDFFAVTTEFVDVLFHPVQCKPLIEETNVCATV